MNEGLILEQLRQDLHKLSRISIIDYIPLLLLLQLVGKPEVESSHVSNHRTAIRRLVATLWPGAPVGLNSRVCSLVNRQVLLRAEGLSTAVEAAPEGLYAEVNSLVGF